MRRSVATTARARRYVPEQDPVQGSLSETTVSTNIIKMPRGTKTHVKVWSGHDNKEALLDFAQQVGGLIKRLGYWQAVEEADEAVATAKQTLADASAALKTAKREESKTRNNSNASSVGEVDSCLDSCRCRQARTRASGRRPL
jgi:hypothetical protein